MNRFIRPAVVCLLLLGVNAAPVFARTRSTKAKPAETHVTTIASVTPESITIVEDKVTKSFTITPFTEINVNGQRAKVSDLQPGMLVTVTLGTDASKLSRIDAGPVPVATPSR